jgi:hypothetical protein
MDTSEIAEVKTPPPTGKELAMSILAILAIIIGVVYWATTSDQRQAEKDAEDSERLAQVESKRLAKMVESPLLSACLQDEVGDLMKAQKIVSITAQQTDLLACGDEWNGPLQWKRVCKTPYVAVVEMTSTWEDKTRNRRVELSYGHLRTGASVRTSFQVLSADPMKVVVDPANKQRYTPEQVCKQVSQEIKTIAEIVSQ